MMFGMARAGWAGAKKGQSVLLCPMKAIKGKGFQKASMG
jgi:hypothetical protein